MFELSITVSDDERKVTKKYVMHTPISIEHEDESLAAMVKEVVDMFNGEPDSITIKIRMEW